jgi:DNA/RNA endonuclease YhcR with UshA esterase domain
MQSPTKQFVAAIVITLICVAALTEVPGQAGAVYAAAEAAKHIGENATITDKVDGVHQSGKGNVFLNMGGRYPNQAFTAFIPAGSAAQFPEVQHYQGRTVAVSGKITLYRGKPEIVVTSPSQVVAK